jgi:hypothetical protein
MGNVFDDFILDTVVEPARGDNSTVSSEALAACSGPIIATLANN